MAGNNYNYNIPLLFQQYFGISLPFIPPPYKSHLEEVSGGAYTSPVYLPKPVEVNKSYYGVPIYEQVTLSYQENGDTIIDYTFPGWPLIEYNRGKKIVKTDVTDNPGTVKEFIGFNDIEITIRGFLINHAANAIPIDDMKALNQVVDINEALKITSEVANALDIHYLVIENLRFPEVEASLNVQPFIIDAISDYPFELVIQEAKNSQVLTAQQKARQLLLNQ